MVGDVFVALGIDKGECLMEAEKGDSSAASFMASVNECICERDHKLYTNRDLVNFQNIIVLLCYDKLGHC